MAAIKWHNPELFEEYSFGTWYHEDTWKTESESDELAEDVRKTAEEKIQFYGFFKEIGLIT